MCDVFYDPNKNLYSGRKEDSVQRKWTSWTRTHHIKYEQLLCDHCDALNIACKCIYEPDTPKHSRFMAFSVFFSLDAFCSWFSVFRHTWHICLWFFLCSFGDELFRTYVVLSSALLLLFIYFYLFLFLYFHTCIYPLFVVVVVWPNLHILSNILYGTPFAFELNCSQWASGSCECSLLSLFLSLTSIVLVFP